MSSTAYQETEAFFSDLYDRLFPILRSITGPGQRESYDIMSEFIPFDRLRVPSGTKVFDWTVPKEWRCDEAYLVGPDGQKVLDIKDCNLHVLNYSTPIDARMSLEELKPHLFSIPDRPSAIPYVSSYYKERWGFCISQEQLDQLPDGEYHAVIKSEHYDGAVELMQTFLPGESKKEILISTYMCHPSLANNELSGPLVLLGLYHRIKNWKNRRYTYRFVIHPETIGSLCLLHLHHEEMKKNIVGGMVVNILGGRKPHLTYKHSLFKDGVVDKAILHSQKHGVELETLDFTPNSGADERQYASPGFRIPVCNATRDFYNTEYRGYHNSWDTKEYMGIDTLLKSVKDLEKVFLAADCCVKYENMAPFGEPQLGPRGLYPTLNFVGRNQEEAQLKVYEELCHIKWLLTLSDGDHDAIDIAEVHGCNVTEMREHIDKLVEHGLLKQRD